MNLLKNIETVSLFRLLNISDVTGYRWVRIFIYGSHRNRIVASECDSV